MYLLDTDSVSNCLDKRRGNERLRQRVEQASPNTIWISIITFEEIIRGILNFTVITSNTRHFSKIPNLRIEDWSV